MHETSARPHQHGHHGKDTTKNKTTYQTRINNLTTKQPGMANLKTKTQPSKKQNLMEIINEEKI